MMEAGRLAAGGAVDSARAPAVSAAIRLPDKATHLLAQGGSAMNYSRMLEVNGAQLYVEEAGAGRPLIMLHGHLLDSSQWDTQMEPFAGRYRVIRYDARGFGRSTKPAAPFAFHEDLRGVMDALGIERALLIGCSGGGATIIDFALAYPGRAEALVLVGTALSGFPFPVPDEIPPVVRNMIEARQRGDITAAVEYGLQLWVDGRRRPEQVDPAVRERTRLLLTDLWSRPPVEAEERGLEPPAYGRLAELRAPALAVVGGEDNPLLHDIAAYLVAHAPRARSVVIPDAGHHPNMEHPEAFNRLVLEFLKESI
jgi:3-oxoadipate enol-lactonase